MSVPPFLALPPGTRRVTLATPRGPLAALDARPAAARGTAVLVPGFTGSKEDFIAILGPLVRAGWRVVALDQRGQFESTGPDDAAAYGLRALAADLGHVARRLADGDGPVHLLGHSHGGLVVRRTLRLLDDPRSAVASAVLLASGPGSIPPERQGPIPALCRVLPATPLEAVWDAKEALDRAAGWDPPPAPVREFLRRRFLATNPWSLLGMGTDLLTAEDDVDEVAGCGVPVLVAHGVDDDVWPVEQQEDMARRLGSVAVTLPGCAHSPAAEAPTTTAALLDAFWDSGDPSRAVRPRRDVGSRTGPDRTARAGVDGPATGYPPVVHIDAPLDHGPTASGTARRLIARQLAEWGAESLIDDAELLASELVTNAVRHAHAPTALRLSWTGGVLRVEVRDASPGALPLPRESGDDATDGRGMLVVQRLSDRWGWDRGPDGKVVWAELSTPGRSAAP